MDVMLAELRQALVQPGHTAPISDQSLRYWLKKLKIKTKRAERDGYLRAFVTRADSQRVVAAFRKANNVPNP